MMWHHTWIGCWHENEGSTEPLGGFRRDLRIGTLEDDMVLVLQADQAPAHSDYLRDPMRWCHPFEVLRGSLE